MSSINLTIRLVISLLVGGIIMVIGTPVFYEVAESSYDNIDSNEAKLVIEKTYELFSFAPVMIIVVIFVSAIFVAVQRQSSDF